MFKEFALVFQVLNTSLSSFFRQKKQHKSYIPANAEIIDVQVKITTACDGASQNLSVGTSVAANELFSALALGTAADTIFFGSAGTITDADTWEDVGAADVQLWFVTSAGSAGVGTITVQYVQN